MFLIIKDICAVIGAFCIVSFLAVSGFALIAYGRTKSGHEGVTDRED